MERLCKVRIIYYKYTTIHIRYKHQHKKSFSRLHTESSILLGIASQQYLPLRCVCRTSSHALLITPANNHMAPNPYTSEWLPGSGRGMMPTPLNALACGSPIR